MPKPYPQGGRRGGAGGAPTARFALVAELAAEGVPVKQACLSLGVSRAGFYEAHSRPPSARTIRQAWLTDQIAAVHEASRQTYGAPRVRAELVLGHGVTVSRKTVAALMRRAGLSGPPLRRNAKRVPAAITVTDLVKRNFQRDGPNQLWVTDITAYPIRERKPYCCVVLDVYSRRAGLLPSLGTVGDPYDNAVAEAFRGRIRTELLDRQRWRTRIELANSIFEYIEGFYNRRRRHSALEWMSPIQVRSH